jgi:hypothetical protein
MLPCVYRSSVVWILRCLNIDCTFFGSTFPLLTSQWKHYQNVILVNSTLINKNLVDPDGRLLAHPVLISDE